MTRFEVTVRLADIVETDAPSARRAVEERLRAAGFPHWQVLSVGLPGVSSPPPLPRSLPWDSKRVTGLLGVGLAVWLLWVLWLIAG